RLAAAKKPHKRHRHGRCYSAVLRHYPHRIVPPARKSAQDNSRRIWVEAAGTREGGPARYSDAVSVSCGLQSGSGNAAGCDAGCPRCIPRQRPVQCVLCAEQPQARFVQAVAAGGAGRGGWHFSPHGPRQKDGQRHQDPALEFAGEGNKGGANPSNRRGRRTKLLHH
ncbi:hypothetical protein HDU91_003661, partial [Kappamyces sp. JEL0680]